MPKGYHHLTYSIRCQIYALKARGDSLRAIGRTLGVHHTNIGRELRRNSDLNGYCYETAHSKAIRRRHLAPNKRLTPKIITVIENRIRLQWSPVQISGWLKRHAKDHVSHETIYQHIWRNKRKGGLLYKDLRRKGKKYNKRSKVNAGRGCIPGRVDIDQRPEIVEEKTRLGDWELDTIIGAGHRGAIVSMVERRSKLTKLVVVPNKTAQNIETALIEKLRPLKKFVYTLTSDNGKEFANHQSVGSKLDAGFYFAKPYQSWQRGLNEHTNGLIRQYFPKGQSFINIPPQAIERVEMLLNTRPRKILNFETPLETFTRLSSNMVQS